MVALFAIEHSTGGDENLSKELLRLHASYYGRLFWEMNPVRCSSGLVSQDDKGKGFWDDVDVEDRRLLVEHMEAVLVRLGQADLRCEELRRRAAQEQNPRRKKDLNDAAALALQQLEIVAGQAIELGRALSTRPGLKQPEIPEEIPNVIQNNPVSSYAGQEGVPDNPPEINVGSGVPRGEA